MAINSSNALLTYAEICKLYHFCEFNGTCKSATLSNATFNLSYKYNWTNANKGQIATYGFFFILFNDTTYFSGNSSPVTIYGNTQSQNQVINYVDATNDTATNGIITFSFNWSAVSVNYQPMIIISKFGAYNSTGERFINRTSRLLNSTLVGYLFMSETDFS